MNRAAGTPCADRCVGLREGDAGDWDCWTPREGQVSFCAIFFSRLLAVFHNVCVDTKLVLKRSIGSIATQHHVGFGYLTWRVDKSVCSKSIPVDERPPCSTLCSLQPRRGVPVASLTLGYADVRPRQSRDKPGA